MREDRAILITGGTVVPITGRESGAADVVVFGLGVESVRHVLVDVTGVVESIQLRTGDSARIRGRARVAGAAVTERLGWS